MPRFLVEKNDVFCKEKKEMCQTELFLQLFFSLIYFATNSLAITVV